MEWMIAVSLALFAMVGAACSNILSDEFNAWHPWIVRKIIAVAVSWMPKDERQRWSEEWSGYTSEVPGQLGKIFAAVGFILAAWKVNRHVWNYRLLKRTFDLVVASCAVAALIPLLLTVGILIRISSRGPIFWALRVSGKGGRDVFLLKYRTMRVEDGRIDGVGRFIRRTGLDELPQLINVLRGDMSLVGPRARNKSWHDECGKVNPDLAEALRDSRPGLVPLSGDIYPGSDGDELELEYLKQPSFLRDLRVLLEVIPRTLMPEVYEKRDG